MMVFMGLIFFKVASGLCLYFIASSLWGVAERKLLPKSTPPKSGDGSKTSKLLVPRQAREAPPRTKPATNGSRQETASRTGDGRSGGKKKKRKKSRGRK
jgi:YidC/Oxa1 family membrane protein insertase